MSLALPILRIDSLLPPPKKLHLMHTTRTDPGRTQTYDPGQQEIHDNELVSRYQSVLGEYKLSWTSHLRFSRRLGSGGQGIVFLSDRKGSDGFTLPVAVKVFSPDRFPTAVAYEESMARIARVAAKVARIQHENLLDVQNFIDRRRIRIMSMEWVEGFDLRRLMDPTLLDRIRHRLSDRRWRQLNEIVMTAGPRQPRFKPGVAIAIVRDCLAALAALHREGIAHCDLKPANVMLKRSGHAKIIDFGSAIEIDDPPLRRSCTPAYSAIEVLEGRPFSPRSDLASLGYVLVELLSGRQVFEGLESFDELVQAKRELPRRLHEILPRDVACNELLMQFCQRLIAPDENLRFRSADDANLNDFGAATFHRQLIKSDLASEYDNEIRILVSELLEIPELQNE